MRLLRSGLPFVFFLLCELNICFETGVLLETIPAMPYVHHRSLLPLLLEVADIRSAAYADSPALAMPADYQRRFTHVLVPGK